MNRILFISNHGGGWANYVEVEDGVTISEFFDTKMGKQYSEDEDGNAVSSSPNNFTIRVNRQEVPSDYVLQEGDRVSFTAKNVAGA